MKTIQDIIAEIKRFFGIKVKKPRKKASAAKRKSAKTTKNKAKKKTSSKVSTARQKKKIVTNSKTATNKKKTTVAVKKATKKTPATTKKKTPTKRKTTATKKKAAKSPKKKIASSSKPTVEIKSPQVGEITHYFSKIKVVVLKVTKTPIKIGDQINIKGKSTDIVQKIKSMQIESLEVKSAKKGQLVGLKVSKVARVGDKVYKLN